MSIDVHNDNFARIGDSGKLAAAAFRAAVVTALSLSLSPRSERGITAKKVAESLPDELSAGKDEGYEMLSVLMTVLFMPSSVRMHS